MNRTFNKILEYTAIGSVFATVFVPLMVSVSLFFPYITGKAHLFRLLVLLATAAYLLLVIRDRSFLPRKNVLLWSSVAFAAVLGVATLTSVDPSRSFWSNFERMEGYVTILHLLALFIVSCSVLRTRALWAVLFSVSLGVSIVMGLQGFAELAEKKGVFGSFRMSGTLGNSSYLGIYSLMHVFMAGFLATALLKAKPFVEAPGRYIGLGAIGLFNLIVMYSTGTRGSFAGLVAGLFIVTVLVAVFEKNNKAYRKAAIGALAVVLVVVSLLGALKNTAFIKGNDLLYRFSSLVTTDVKGVLAEQGKARTLLWGMAWEGVKEKPLLGWGQDNFGFVFAKHYDPAMYGQEQWFDRTHNVFMDWLIASGFMGLISYLGLFGAALYMIWRNRSSEAEWTISERAILTGFLAAYFVHNLFVFDNLSSYILFFLVLAYASARNDGRTGNDISSSKVAPLVSSEPVQYVAGTLIAVALVSGMYFVVYKPYAAGKALISALQASSAQNPSAENITALYKKALSYDTFGTTEINERLAEAAPQLIQANQGQPVADELIRLVATQYEEAFKKTPGDPRPFIFYGMFMQRLGLYDDALMYIDKALALSPSKQSFHYQRGLTLVAQTKMTEASESFKTAYELDKSNLEAKNLYGISLIYASRLQDARVLFGDDMNSWGDARVLSVLEETMNFAEIVRIAKARVAENPENPQHRMFLASAYLKAKQPANAIVEIQAVIDMVPEFKAQGESYIKDIRAGKDPSAQSAQ
ncbi:MAG TPA: O-antigen ligase family protein [Candidatus Paceibacterota bacterium]